MVTKARGIRKGRLRDLSAKGANGKPVRPFRETSRQNGRPRKVFITQGGGARADSLLTHPLDYRSVLGKRYQHAIASMTQHLGGSLSYPESQLVDQCARLGLLATLSWSEVVRDESLIKDDKVNPAIDVFLRTSKQQRDLLALLGIKCRVRDITLEDVLAGKVEQ